MDCWQAALEDVGPAGVDKGKGGKYLILPPGHKDTPPDGYFVLQSQTFQGFALLRSIVRSGGSADIAKAVDYGKQIKLYPLSEAASPPQTTFVDMINVVFDATIPYDMRFFQSLDRMVQSEPWLPRDMVMIDMLRSIGIEKGKPFKPDAKTQKILNAGISEAHAWLNARYETVFVPYYGAGQWFVPATEDIRETASTFYETANAYSVDARGLATIGHSARSSTLEPGSSTSWRSGYRRRSRWKQLSSDRTRQCAGQAVLVAVVYDRSTHAFIRNASRLSRSSQNPDLQKNGDGSVDVYFGLMPPAGKQTNWIQTNPNGKFEVLFRFYGPEKPLFDKTWKLPDIEKIVAR
jgi:hypothetical protein